MELMHTISSSNIFDVSLTEHEISQEGDIVLTFKDIRLDSQRQVYTTAWWLESFNSYYYKKHLILH